MDILKLLDLFPHLENDDLQKILFDNRTTKRGILRAPKGGENAANRALRFLFDAGYIDRIPLYLLHPHNWKNGREALVNVLTRRGADALQSWYDEHTDGQLVRWKPSRNPESWREQFHEGLIAKAGIHAMKACLGTDYQLWGWEEDRYLFQQQRQDLYHFPNRPDALFIITNKETNKDFVQLLEIDRGSESHFSATDRTTIHDKIAGYTEYLKRDGMYEQDFAGLDKPIILFLVPSEKRRENIIETIEAFPPSQVKGGAYWAATFQDYFRGFFDGVWRVPRESGYRSLHDRFQK